MEKVLKRKKVQRTKKITLKAIKKPIRKAKTDDLGGPMSDYVLIELSTSTLGNLIAYTIRETYLENQKESPNQDRIAKLDALYEEVYAVNRNSANFRDYGIMRDIIEKYCPIMKKINMGKDPFK